MKPYVRTCTDDEYFDALVKEAPYIEGWHTNTESVADIEWLDRGLLEKSKDFMFKHRFVLSASTGIAAAYGISYKPISLAFMQSGTLTASSEKTVKRTVKHVTHFVEWFTRGCTSDWVYDDIQKIKKMHTFLSKTIKPYTPPPDETLPNWEEHKKFKDAVEHDFGEMNLENKFDHLNKYNPDIYFSQFDMVMIQADLLAGFSYPHIHLVDEKESFDGFIHHWAVIGRLLGIHDRFNLALHPSKELYARIHNNMLATMLQMDLPLSRLMESHLKGVTFYFHAPCSAASVLYLMSWGTELPGFKGNELWKLMNWKDKIGFYFFASLKRPVECSTWMKNIIRSVGPAIAARVSGHFHKLSKEDKMKLPIEFVI